jgi:hypothetical protein
LQYDSNSGIEELVNPKDELNKKIVALANTMREWNEKTKEARKSVREQLKDIIDLGKKRKMDKNELRKLINAIFEIHGIHRSWLRRLLPEGLKDTSKKRISYQQKQEIEKERQRLLQQMPKSQQASTSLSSPEYISEFESGSSGSEFNLEKYTPTTSYAFMEPKSPDNDVPAGGNRSIETNIRIQDLEAEVRHLSEPFVAKTYLQTKTEDIPLVVEIDPVKKVIISVQID